MRNRFVLLTDRFLQTANLAIGLTLVLLEPLHQYKYRHAVVLLAGFNLQIAVSAHLGRKRFAVFDQHFVRLIRALLVKVGV
jgi:hypothetical protein